MSTTAPSSIDVTPDDVNSLVAQAQGGDEGAFSFLVRAHHASVRAFLGRYVRDPASVDDLAQDTFITAHRRLPTFRGESQFSSWLLGIARNLALTFLRDEGRRQRREGRVMDACLDQWQAARLEHEDELQQHQSLLDALEGCIDQLQENAQEMVQAFYFQNERADSIAQRLNRKSSAVRMSLLRIRKALAACVRRKTEESS